MSLEKPDWYRAPIDRDQLRMLTKRRDGPGLIWFGVWLALLLFSGGLAWFLMGSWWAIPAFLVFGTLYGFAESIAHECSHSTAFKSKRLNEGIYLFVSFLLFKERTYHRWMHGRHHTHTIIKGQDPEIQHPQPINLVRFFALEPLRLTSTYHFFTVLMSHSLNRPVRNATAWIPRGKHKKMFFWSRIQLTTYLSVLCAIGWSQSWALLLLFPAPRFYGAIVQTLFSSTQHTGLAENVEDHRLNSRTILLGPVGRFLYWNMNYHLEHHMYPTVPFHSLPRLHEEIKHHCPPPCHGMLGAYRELLPIIWNKRQNASSADKREVPA